MSILEKYSAALKNKDEAAMNELLHDNFIYKLIPNSKSEIDKLVKSGIY